MRNTDLVFAEACSAYDDKYIYDAITYYDTLPDFEYSDDFEKKMDRLCSRMATGKYSKLPKPFKALLVAAIITAILSSTATAVPPTRALEKNYIKNTNSKRSLFEFKVDPDTYGSLYSNYTVPSDFELVEQKQLDGIGETLKYVSADGSTLTCKSGKNGNTSYTVNTENAIEVSEVSMHGTTACFVNSENSEFYSLCWAQGECNYKLILMAPKITKEEFIDIAKSRENVYEEKILGLF